MQWQQLNIHSPNRCPDNSMKALLKMELLAECLISKWTHQYRMSRSREYARGQLTVRAIKGDSGI